MLYWYTTESAQREQNKKATSEKYSWNLNVGTSHNSLNLFFLWQNYDDIGGKKLLEWNISPFSV